MDIGEMLSRAWKITWKHKVLWIFGILASCGGSGAWGGGSSGGGASSSSSGNSGGIFAPGWPDFQGFIEQIEPYLPLILITLICLSVILVAIAVILGVIGRVGLIRGAQQAEEGAERLLFSELFNYSLRYFWRVLGLVLLTMIAVPLFVLFVGMPITILTCGLGGLALTIVLFMLPVIIEQTIIAIVIEDLDILEGLQRGWEIFRSNLVTMIFLALILILGLGVVVSLVVAAPLAFLITPFVTGLLVGGAQAIKTGAIISGICFCGFIPVLIVLMGLVRAYTEVAWTLTYLRLTRKTVVPPSADANLPEAL